MPKLTKDVVYAYFLLNSYSVRLSNPGEGKEALKMF